MNALPIPNPAATLPTEEGAVVARLRESQIFRDYQKAFETATGLPLVLRAAGSFSPPLHGAKKIAPFCALMGGASKTCAACLELQARMEEEAVTTSKTLRCFAGLSESVVPLRLGEKVIGYLQTGQVMLQAPSERSFATAVTGLAKWHQALDLAQLREAYFETRVINRLRYDAVLRLLASFAQHLSLICNDIMIRQTESEPAAVARARVFIDEHLAEDITLEQVARAACTSSFYFCKIFKAATGVTFTDYVARLRVERAKRLLASPHTRVSEAAYASGFQSLSQFNRVFRRVEGQSPTDYRAHLPGAGAMCAA